MGGRFNPAPPGGVPGHSSRFSLGSPGRTPSPTTGVSAKAGAASEARPVARSLRRSMIFLPCFIKGHTLFRRAARRIVRVMKQLLLALLLTLPALADDGPAYG